MYNVIKKKWKHHLNEQYRKVGGTEERYSDNFMLVSLIKYLNLNFKSKLKLTENILSLGGVGKFELGYQRHLFVRWKDIDMIAENLSYPQYMHHTNRFSTISHPNSLSLHPTTPDKIFKIKVLTLITNLSIRWPKS